MSQISLDCVPFHILKFVFRNCFYRIFQLLDYKTDQNNLIKLRRASQIKDHTKCHPNLIKLHLKCLSILE
jgi:hypothetical protein